jgi:hypothetical protein
MFVKGVSMTGTSKNSDFIPTAALRKKFIGYIYTIYTIYGAAKVFASSALRALLTTPHGLLLPVADRRPLVGHLGEL